MGRRSSPFRVVQSNGAQILEAMALVKLRSRWIRRGHDKDVETDLSGFCFASFE